MSDILSSSDSQQWFNEFQFHSTFSWMHTHTHTHTQHTNTQTHTYSHTQTNTQKTYTHLLLHTHTLTRTSNSDFCFPKRMETAKWIPHYFYPFVQNNEFAPEFFLTFFRLFSSSNIIKKFSNIPEKLVLLPKFQITC